MLWPSSVSLHCDPNFGRKRPCILEEAQANYTSLSPITLSNTQKENTMLEEVQTHNIPHVIRQ